MKKFLLLMLLLMLVSCKAISSSNATGFREFSAKIPTTELPKDSYLDFVPDEYYQTVVNLAIKHHIPVYYFAKLIYEESRYNPRAVNRSNSNGTVDYGIAQLNSQYIDDFAYKYGYDFIDPFEPYTALEVAAVHLHTLYNTTRSWKRALAAYNCGIGNVLRGTIPDSTLDYVERIMKEDV